ncbi:MAG: hypothetical protein HQP61_08630 [Peptococcaceae bacterium]|nr:hypothetical protein [Candidatus Syntrophopropionicum ammoniitolerans]
MIVNWLMLLLSFAVVYYTYTFGRWALEKGNRRGGIGIFILAAFVLSLSVYGIFFTEPY